MAHRTPHRPVPILALYNRMQPAALRGSKVCGAVLGAFVVASLVYWWTSKTNNSASKGESSNATQSMTAGLRNSKSISAEASNSSDTVLAEAKERLLATQSIANLPERATVAASIIRDLCQAGLQNQAWELIATTAGHVRDQQVYSWFMYAGLDSAAAFRKMGWMADSDLWSSLSGYLRSVSDIDSIDTILQSEEFSVVADRMGNDAPNAVSSILGSNLELKAMMGSTPESRDALLNLALKYHDNGLLQAHEVTKLLSRCSHITPQTQWNLLQTKLLDAPVDYSNKLIQQLVDENAPDALNTIVNSPNEKSTEHLTLALTRWGALDSAGANDWMKTIGMNLRLPQRDAAIEALIELAVNYRELDGAFQWAQQISAPDRKRIAIERLGKAEQR